MPDTQPIQPAQKPTPAANPSEEKIHFTLRNRNQIVFNDYVKAITSKNDTGIFDILPEHSNFISLISAPLTIHKLDGQKQEITFKSGLIKVKDNAIFGYIDLLVQGPGK